MPGRRPPQYEAVFYRTQAGNEPVLEWLRGELTKEERRKIGEDIKTLQYRWPLGMPLVRRLGRVLYEIRSRFPTRIARTIFFPSEGSIVLLHGFIKKTEQTPQEDIELALQRRNLHLKAHEKPKQSPPRK